MQEATFKKQIFTTDSFIAENVELYLRDALSAMAELEENSIDLAIVDPPYGASTKADWAYDSKRKLKGFGGDWKLTQETWDLLSQNDNFDSTVAWLAELKRVVMPTGSIWIHSTYHNSGFVNVACQLLGLEIINEVVWYKRNAFPNLAGRRLTASHETILWVHTGGAKREYLFNYEDTKRAHFPGDNLKVADKQLRTVWDIPNNKDREELKFGTHPTQKSLRVAHRLLLIAGKQGGKLLVPFAGSGTEMIAGLRYGMSTIGYEVDEGFFGIAKARLEHEVNRTPLLY
jgi:site-specific DNA-methyltransferase (adenine-specific)